MTQYHPTPELLLDFAAGSLAEPIALAVATHLSLCEACRRTADVLDAMGGTLLDGVEAVEAEPEDDRLLEAMLSRLDEPEPIRGKPPVLDAETRALIPPPLRAYLGASLAELPWRRIGGIGTEARLATAAQGYKVSLMRLKPGSVMPRHTHRGCEYTLVLSGSYRDGSRQLMRGDLDVNDPSHEHRPVVDPDEECLCLVVLDAPLRLTGPVGRFVNPFLRV